MEKYLLKLAIVGSRDFGKTQEEKEIIYQKIAEFIYFFGFPDVIISGGAAGIDSLAEEYAKTHSIPTEIFPALWNIYGLSAGILRNSIIVENATHVLAFPSVKGKGTQDTIKKAEKKGIPCIVHYLDKEDLLQSNKEKLKFEKEKN